MHAFEARFKLALERESSLIVPPSFMNTGLFSSSPLGRSEETSVVQKTAPSASSSLALLFHSRFSFESAFDPPRNPIDLQFRFLFLPFHLSFFFSFPYPRIWIINSRENRGARRYLGGRRKNLRGRIYEGDRNEVGSVEEGSNGGCFCGRKRVCGGSKKIRQGRLAWSSPLASNFFGKCCPFRCAL